MSRVFFSRDKDGPNPPGNPSARFFVVPVKKVVLLHFFTLGFYWYYWSYRNWATWQRHESERLSPLGLALISPLSLYSLLRRVDSQLQSSGRSYSWSPLMFALAAPVPMALFALSCCMWGEWSGFSPADQVHPLYRVPLALILTLLFAAAALQAWLFSGIQLAVNIVENDRGGTVRQNWTLKERTSILPGQLLWAVYIASLFLFLVFWLAIGGLRESI